MISELDNIDCPRCSSDTDTESTHSWLGDSKLVYILNIRCSCGLDKELRTYFRT